jgi:hypothetical protein
MTHDFLSAVQDCPRRVEERRVGRGLVVAERPDAARAEGLVKFARRHQLTAFKRFDRGRANECGSLGGFHNVCSIQSEPTRPLEHLV